MKIKIIFLLWTTVFGLGYYESTHLSIEYPDYIPDPIYPLDSINSAQQLLGRVLFYDPLLSRDGTISCASCHSPYNAFAHTDHDLSHGIDDQIGDRNAPALFNLAWQPKYMWDGAIHHIDMQALAPLTNPIEMDSPLDSVLVKLKRSSLYKNLFKEAYGDSEITTNRILKAFSAFQLSLVSFDAKYDKVRAGLDSFSRQEANGYQIFKENCNSCHQEPLFSDYSFKSNGLKVDTTINDWGRYRQSLLPKDSLLFKVPSLRNLKFSYPYMHDGRFQNLREVIEHYSKEIEASDFLSAPVKGPIQLSSNEKVDLMAFLLTLNDKTFVFDPANKYPREILLNHKN